MCGTPVLAVLALVCAAARPGAQQGTPGLSLERALEVTLAEQPQIQLSREELAASEAALQTITGRFDMRLGGAVDRSHASAPLRDFEREARDTSEILTDITQYRFGLEKTLRTGLTIAPLVGVTRQDVNLDQPAANRASIALSLTQPLMRGRGRDVVTAEEQAARIDVTASGEDVRHTAALSVLRTALAYWDYVAAARNLDVITASEGRARQLVDETRALIEADNRPAADLKQVQGNLAERIAFRSSAEQALFEARHNVGRAMGLAPENILALPMPADPFPSPGEPVRTIGDPELVSQAIEGRADLQASNHRRRSTDVLVAAARDELKPQVDLNLNLGYSGLAEGLGWSPLFSAIQRRMSGPNAAVSFTYAFPTANNTAIGLLGRAEAANRQLQIRILDLTRAIRANVAVAQDDLARSAERVKALREAAELYLSAVDDERQKLQLGLSTVIDLVLIEDRLTRSLLDEIAASRTYAQALAQLRFETATIVEGTGVGEPGVNQLRANPTALTTFP